jgi:hypothetical protein
MHRAAAKIGGLVDDAPSDRNADPEPLERIRRAKARDVWAKEAAASKAEKVLPAEES